MPTVKQFTLAIGVTANTGDYTSKRYEMSATVDLEPGEHINDAVEVVEKEIEDIIRSNIQKTGGLASLKRLGLNIAETQV